MVLPGAGSAASTRDPGGVLSTLLTLAVCVGGSFCLVIRRGGLDRLGTLLQLSSPGSSRSSEWQSLLGLRWEREAGLGEEAAPSS